MKTAQELFDEEFIPTHYIEKSIWNNLEVGQQTSLVSKRIITNKTKDFAILETSRHIIFFCKS